MAQARKGSEGDEREEEEEEEGYWLYSAHLSPGPGWSPSLLENPSKVSSPFLSSALPTLSLLTH